MGQKMDGGSKETNKRWRTKKRTPKWKKHWSKEVDKVAQRIEQQYKSCDRVSQEKQLDKLVYWQNPSTICDTLEFNLRTNQNTL